MVTPARGACDCHTTQLHTQHAHMYTHTQHTRTHGDTSTPQTSKFLLFYMTGKKKCQKSQPQTKKGLQNQDIEQLWTFLGRRTKGKRNAEATPKFQG